ncbi:MAG: ferrous iron transport protein B [Nitrososphaeria archaeon]
MWWWSVSEKKIRIALAGNANVGKSVIFNHLTGLHQHIGNWPGKTVEKAEGTLHFKGYTIDIIDLPGIYSLSTFSLEEKISREYIACEAPDVVVNVVDASVLERNLYFTLQLMELETPMIMALNQMDMAKNKGIEIDTEKLTQALGISVIPTIATKGVGLYDIVEEAVTLVSRKAKPSVLRYGEEVEKRIMQIADMIGGSSLKYPPRYAAVQLLQGDEEIEKEVGRINPEIIKTARKLSAELEEIYGHPSSTVIASERYDMAARITRNVQVVRAPVKPPAREILHNITTNKILGYPIMAATVLVMFYTVFTFGDLLSKALTSFLEGWQPIFATIFGVGLVEELFWGGIFEGVIAGITIVIPYIAPFYVILYFLEDSGYLSRIAFLMDSLMHKIGLHGKALIPIMLGYGCNVPACLGCRIIETERERLIAGFITTLVPCAARTAIILGLVGAFVGVQWVLALYIFNLLVILAIGRIVFKALPGEPTALIMEMSDYKVPRLRTVVKQAWFRLEEFIKIAFPLIIVGSLSIKILEVLRLLEPIGNILSPVTVTWLGLPLVTGVALIFGVLRKELTLVMLATLLGTTDFSSVLTPLQMIVFTLVTLFYVPCISTIAALVKEYGLRKALLITLFEIMFAIVIGGVAFRLLQAFVFH